MNSYRGGLCHRMGAAVGADVFDGPRVTQRGIEFKAHGAAASAYEWAAARPTKSSFGEEEPTLTVSWAALARARGVPLRWALDVPLLLVSAAMLWLVADAPFPGN